MIEDVLIDLSVFSDSNLTNQIVGNYNKPVKTQGPCVHPFQAARPIDQVLEECHLLEER
jgi:hypothetical protein